MREDTLAVAAGGGATPTSAERGQNIDENPRDAFERRLAREILAA